MKWVHLVKTTLEGGSPSQKVVATAILEDGTVRIDGDSPMAANLRKSGTVSAAGKKTVADGEDFLRALGQQFSSAQLYATDVQEGDKVTPPAPLAPMQKAA